MHQFLKFIFGIKFYMFRTVPLSLIRSFSLYTQQWYMSYKFADSLRAGSGWNCSSVLILLTAVSKPVWHIPLLCIQWKTPDDGQKMELQFLPDPACSCQQTCMTYTCSVCTMKNSWWWTEELSKTCRVSFQKQIWEVSASRWFYFKNNTWENVVWIYEPLMFRSCISGDFVQIYDISCINCIWTPLSHKSA